MLKIAGILTLLLAVTAIGLAQEKYPIQKPLPGDKWQKPGPIQKPGEIQAPKGIEAIKSEKADCQQRMTVVADALFEFDKASLTADAEETLTALGPMIAQAGNHPITIEGHTDSKGTAQYNQALSEKRAQTVKAWLAAHQYVTQSASVKGFGKNRPVAPNANSDGSDNPDGRQKNRRVEIVIDTCH
jgi:outer membrane protein OmpA-like peptidoglycan-associated protein